jgi:hypothetical protein
LSAPPPSSSQAPVRPPADIKKTEAKPEAKPVQQAQAPAPSSASSGSVMAGAQPVVPAGAFDSRWGSFK